MSELIFSALMLLSVHQTALIDDEYVIPDNVADAANEADVSAIDLMGAVNTTGLDPFEYLFQVGELQRPIPIKSVPAGYSARVRVTYYTLTGITYSGIRLYPGSTACSWNWAIGTKFQFDDGEIVTCIDRGILGDSGWLDVWRNPSLAHKYEPYTTVTVLN